MILKSANFICIIRQSVWPRSSRGKWEKADVLPAEGGAGYEEPGQRNPVERVWRFEPAGSINECRYILTDD